MAYNLVEKSITHDFLQIFSVRPENPKHFLPTRLAGQATFSMSGDIIPTIPVATRQAKIVGQISVRARQWLKDSHHDESGCKVIHDAKCVACERMKATDTFCNQIISRKYSIRRTYTLHYQLKAFVQEKEICLIQLRRIQTLYFWYFIKETSYSRVPD